ncbi:hypothetical protein NQ015_05685 [Corynebacterium sp. 153RC1]|uniref:hypothetical protein n=1 Tax=unclassified Corynebacterium TaxID=2624378 RepID=UPI00211BC74D|nr:MULTISPECIES: hypothetical protein [unclassified Corynebacterium]MCQ9352497.1 hypothetical protein [Corynebacterium sp. 209RC1]MCQ9354681.1 hypothetical protein [Corynebacterium sp. 1222RC1]MCQ9356792.1 hypothetical protein [Corynebacterium sp. 122RC1]MCQ9359004.1 hypothetical protein [Corynebacterium sp. 142RC1]MCQ9361260.1 hypothetical protein [Corynebacterium sp. 153RC1]
MSPTPNLRSGAALLATSALAVSLFHPVAHAQPMEDAPALNTKAAAQVVSPPPGSQGQCKASVSTSVDQDSNGAQQNKGISGQMSIGIQNYKSAANNSFTFRPWVRAYQVSGREVLDANITFQVDGPSGTYTMDAVIPKTDPEIISTVPVTKVIEPPASFQDGGPVTINLGAFNAKGGGWGAADANASMWHIYTPSGSAAGDISVQSTVDVTYKPITSENDRCQPLSYDYSNATSVPAGNNRDLGVQVNVASPKDAARITGSVLLDGVPVEDAEVFIDENGKVYGNLPKALSEETGVTVQLVAAPREGDPGAPVNIGDPFQIQVTAPAFAEPNELLPNWPDATVRAGESVTVGNVGMALPAGAVVLSAQFADPDEAAANGWTLAIDGVTHQLTVTAAPDAEAGDSVSVLVVVRDADGNVIAIDDATITVAEESGPLIIPVPIPWNGSGSSAHPTGTPTPQPQASQLKSVQPTTTTANVVPKAKPQQRVLANTGVAGIAAITAIAVIAVILGSALMLRRRK